MSNETNWKLVHEHYVKIAREERKIERELIRQIAPSLDYAHEFDGECRSCRRKTQPSRILSAEGAAGVVSHAEWCAVGQAKAALDDLLRETTELSPSDT